MISVYRLVKRRWLASAFDGEASRRHGGRWNSPGRACVYCAGSESLARLEALMHLNDGAVMRHYVALQLHLEPEQILHLRQASLPEDWHREPAPPSTAWLGDNWLKSGQSLALAVPSIVVPQEMHYLLNPRHPGFAQVVRQVQGML